MCAGKQCVLVLVTVCAFVLRDKDKRADSNRCALALVGRLGCAFAGACVLARVGAGAGKPFVLMLAMVCTVAGRQRHGRPPSTSHPPSDDHCRPGHWQRVLWVLHSLQCLHLFCSHRQSHLVCILPQAIGHLLLVPVLLPLPSLL